MAGVIEFQAGAVDLWSQLKEMVSSIQTQNNQAVEEKQIKRALGHPVTRIILDQEDQVILHVGELMAPQAYVLDVLLRSVYGGPPRPLIDDLQAPQSGTAVLRITTGD